jgi:hypothetical protein
MRIVQMDLVKHIPSQLTTGGYRALISYNGQLATCGGTVQFTSYKTAQDRTTDDAEIERQTDVVATGRDGKTGKG